MRPPQGGLMNCGHGLNRNGRNLLQKSAKHVFTHSQGAARPSSQPKAGRPSTDAPHGIAPKTGHMPYATLTSLFSIKNIPILFQTFMLYLLMYGQYVV